MSGTARQLIMEAALVWIVLVMAGGFEVVWATAMKQSDGFTRAWPSLVTVGGMIISFGLLAWTMRILPLGTAYMVWTGIGAIGAFIVGAVVFGEVVSAERILATLMIVGGLILMKISS